MTDGPHPSPFVCALSPSYNQLLNLENLLNTQFGKAVEKKGGSEVRGSGKEEKEIKVVPEWMRGTFNMTFRVLIRDRTAELPLCDI